MGSHARQVAAGERFEFGRNWARFLTRLTPARIEQATACLQRMLHVQRLDGQRFLDVGSGSGLSSLAARRLGAQVHSFDVDPECVRCTSELRHRFYPDDEHWIVEEGSALDGDYLARLGRFDVVYSWGVLHHTGAMYEALDLLVANVRHGGLLYLALFNDQGGWSRRWRHLKRWYNRLPRVLRGPYAVVVMGTRELRMLAIALLRFRLGEYVRSWTEYEQQRGMSRWHDLIDWIGGYPFDVARPEEIFRFYRDRGFALEELTTHGASIACNEYVFRRLPSPGDREGV